ncbi:conjugal transfer protein TraP [Klebsiella pneumoniae]
MRQGMRHISTKSYTHNTLWLWLLMAVVFTGMAVVFSVGLTVTPGDFSGGRMSGACVMNRQQEKKEPKPVPQSANYLDRKLYEELVRHANNLAEAVLPGED